MQNPVFIRTLSDIEAIEQTPWQERLKPRNTYDMLQQGASINPDAPAIYFIPNGDAYDEPEIVTYRQMMGKINQTANLLHDLGVKPTDVMAMLMPNYPITHAILWGSQAAGIVYPINYLLEPSQIIDLLKAANAKVLFALGPSPDFNIWEKVESIRQELPDLTILQVMGQGSVENDSRIYDAMVEKYPDSRLTSGRHINPDDICAYFATGGTTGSPKLAQHTHLNETFEAFIMSLTVNREPSDCILCGLPMFHVNAVHITGIAPFSAGSSVVLLGTQGFRDRSVIKNFWKIVERFKATSFGGVPTLYASLLQVPLQGEDISTLKHVRCGAAPMPVEVFKAFESQTGIKIIEGYGLTEGTCSSTGNPLYGERRIGSVGFRYPYQEVKIVRLDESGLYLRDCAPNEIGSVVTRGPHVIPGYLQAAYNEHLFVAEGWLNTGDLGRQDADGYLWITGRTKDIIIRGGHNIDPAVIEEVLYSHEAVGLAAAVGKPDAYAGEIPVAYVQLKPGAQIQESVLLAYVRDRISERAAAPKAIYFLETMPQTAVGKLFKPLLRLDITRRAYEEALAPLVTAGYPVSIQVVTDKTHGMIANIQIAHVSSTNENEIRAKAETALAGFTIKYDLQFEE
ncbi:MAG: acyl-CoA synthetase [Chloroflexota bacterium]